MDVEMYRLFKCCTGVIQVLIFFYISITLQVVYRRGLNSWLLVLFVLVKSKGRSRGGVRQQKKDNLESLENDY